jgi:hypothetical protein
VLDLMVLTGTKCSILKHLIKIKGYIYIIGVLTVNISFMWRGLETGERRNGNRPNGNVQIVDEKYKKAI